MALVTALLIAGPAWPQPGEAKVDPPREAGADPQPRAEMQDVFDALTHLLPLAMSESTWADPSNRATIGNWLGVLAKRAHRLEDHAQTRDEGFRYLSRTLAENIEEARLRFELGRYEQARYFLTETTGACVACHSRLPSSRQFPMASRLLDEIDLSSLNPPEQIHLLVATRQFDAALGVWESIFADPAIPPAAIDASGYFVDYLVVALRVQQTPERARQTLEKFMKRDDVSRYLQRDIVSWLRALDTAKADLTRKPSLDRARALVMGDVGPRPEPLGKDQMVYDLIASSVLLRLIDQSTTSTQQLPEAYYLLGLVEARSLDSYWVPQAEYHLETAIRLDPTAKWAPDAFAAFEELVLTGWGGASEPDLPADVSVRLTELRKLVDGDPVEMP